MPHTTTPIDEHDGSGTKRRWMGWVVCGIGVLAVTTVVLGLLRRDERAAVIHQLPPREPRAVGEQAELIAARGAATAIENVEPVRRETRAPRRDLGPGRVIEVPASWRAGETAPTRTVYGSVDFVPASPRGLLRGFRVDCRDAASRVIATASVDSSGAWRVEDLPCCDVTLELQHYGLGLLASHAWRGELAVVLRAAWPERLSADVEFVDVYATEALEPEAVEFFHEDQRIECEVLRALGSDSFRFLLFAPSDASVLEVRYTRGSLVESTHVFLVRGGLTAAWIFERDRANSRRAFEQHWR